MSKRKINRKHNEINHQRSIEYTFSPHSQIFVINKGLTEEGEDVYYICLMLMKMILLEAELIFFLVMSALISRL